MKTIKEIREAEEEYDRLINAAKEKADKTMREAKEKTLEARMKGEEELVGYRNERLRKGSKDIEAEVESIVAKAKDEGARVSKKKPEASAVSRLLKEFLGSL